jgi:Gpi18-like mannosyltransferase
MNNSSPQAEQPQTSVRACTGAFHAWGIRYRSPLTALLRGLSCYVLTSAVVLLGVLFGTRFVNVPADHGVTNDSFVSAFATEDGIWYKKIATHGYSYDPTKSSSVAFFPLYPLLAGIVMRLGDLGPEVALLAVSHVSLALLFVLVSFYVQEKYPTAPPGLPDFILLAMGLMPATLFFRMTYSESLFVLLCVLALLAMARRWPLFLVALLIGLATATRPVGIALLAPFLLHCWRLSATRGAFALKLLFLVPVACWGIAAYSLYQGILFGEPLAFVQTQSHWRRGAAVSFSEKLLSLATYEPIWQVFDPVSPVYWGAGEPYPPNPIFSWPALNSVYFVLTVILIVIGARKRWLSSDEVALAAGLLFIPYFTRSHEMAMASQARFAAAVFPVYLVLGNLLVRLPGSLAGGLLGIAAFYLGAFSALFATWHLVF